MNPQDPPASEAGQGHKRKVHSLIDKVFSRKNLELAWEKVKKNRGSAGIDEVTIAQFEERKEYYLSGASAKFMRLLAAAPCQGGDGVDGGAAGPR